MFETLFKRKKLSIYLGTLAVVPRSDMKRYFDQCPWHHSADNDLDKGMRLSLKEIFVLPSAQEVKEPTNQDLGLDVIVSKFQTGEMLVFTLEDFFIPLFWKPSVAISARLYYLNSDITKATFTVIEKMGWRSYIGRLFTWRAMIRTPYRSLFDKKDMDVLLYLACHKLLVKIKKSI